MKICMLSTIFPRYKGDPCGAGRTVYETARNLKAKHNLDVSIVAPHYHNIPKYEEIDGIKVYRFSYFWPHKFQKLAYNAGIPSNLRNLKLAKIQLPLFILNFFFRAFRIALDADIIHNQWLEIGLVAVPIKKILNKPIVMNVRRVIYSNRWMKWLIKYIVENVDYVFFNSSYTRDKILTFAIPKNYCIIPSILELEKFDDARPGKLRKKIGLSDDALIILYIGYLIEKKGVRYLVDAMPEIIKRNKNVHLVIGGDGFESEFLKKRVKELGLQNNTTFLGWVNHDDLPDYYCDADVFVLPSIIDSKGETETLGMVLVEAMACGTPVIGSNVGGIPDVIKPEVGLLTEPKNSLDIAEKVISIMVDEDKRKKMGQAAKIWVIEQFSWKSVSQKYLEAYQEVLKSI